MAEFTGIIFNDIPMPSYVKVKAIDHSILPPVDQNLLTVGGKAGAYDFGNTVGTREITISIMIIAPEENVMPTLLEQLSEWLYYEDAKELILGDNPNKRYLAKITGDTAISESMIYGEGSITFLCSDPYIYGEEITELIPSNYDGSIIQLTNQGNAETFPTLTFDITKDLTNFSVVSADEFIDIGNAFSIDDDTSNIIDAGGYALRDQLTTTNGWSVAQSIEGATITGTFEVYGGATFRQAGLDYGTGSGWHGASMVRPLLQSVQDFESKFHFEMNSEAVQKYIGTIKLKRNIPMRSGPSTKYATKKTGKTGETYNVVSRASNGWYYLSNGYYCGNSTDYSTFTKAAEVDADKLGTIKFVLRDPNGADAVVVTAKDSQSKVRQCIIEVKVKKGSESHIVFSKALPTSMVHFEGYVYVNRIGKTWRAGVYERVPGKWLFEKRYGGNWIDTAGKFQQKMHSVQIATLAHSTYKASYMELQDIVIVSKDVQASETQVPVILRAGDRLEINNETGVILKNDEPFFEYLNPSSTFISLKKGENGIVVSPSDGFENGKITYTQRSL